MFLASISLFLYTSHSRQLFSIQLAIENVTSQQRFKSPAYFLEALLSKYKRIEEASNLCKETEKIYLFMNNT